MLAHRAGQRAVHPPDHATAVSHPLRLIQKAHVAHNKRRQALVLEVGHIGAGNAQPKVRRHRAAPLGAQRLRQMAVAHAQLGDGLFFKFAPVHPLVINARAGQQLAHHVANGVGKGKARGALGLQNLAHCVFACAGVACQADQYGVIHAVTPF